MTSEFGIAVHAMVFLHHKGCLLYTSDCRWIAPGQTACPLFKQAYTAFGFCAVICQKGYLTVSYTHLEKGASAR